MVDFKLDYMARLFRSIRNKRFESYAIQRIWHLLDDDRVLFVTQQYFKRKNGYALADLYLPQINLVVEIDEGQHAEIKNEILDSFRSGEIQAVNQAEVKRIPICKNLKTDEWYTLAEVNQHISEVVALIKKRIEEKGEKFVPWTGDDMLSPEYHKNKGYFFVSENEYVKTIDDAAAIFDTKVVPRGYLRPGGFDVPGKQNVIVWLPSVNSRNWSNSLIDNGKTIIEYQKTDTNKRDQHVKDVVNKNETHITFFREKDALGFNLYKFVGVFQLNKTKSINQNKCVWERIADRYDLGS